MDVKMENFDEMSCLESDKEADKLFDDLEKRFYEVIARFDNIHEAFANTKMFDTSIDDILDLLNCAQTGSPSINPFETSDKTIEFSGGIKIYNKFKIKAMIYQYMVDFEEGPFEDLGEKIIERICNGYAEFCTLRQMIERKFPINCDLRGCHLPHIPKFNLNGSSIYTLLQPMDENELFEKVL